MINVWGQHRVNTLKLGRIPLWETKNQLNLWPWRALLQLIDEPMSGGQDVLQGWAVPILDLDIDQTSLPLNQCSPLMRLSAHLLIQEHLNISVPFVWLWFSHWSFFFTLILFGTYS